MAHGLLDNSAASNCLEIRCPADSACEYACLVWKAVLQVESLDCEACNKGDLVDSKAILAKFALVDNTSPMHPDPCLYDHAGCFLLHAASDHAQQGGTEFLNQASKQLHVLPV